MKLRLALTLLVLASSVSADEGFAGLNAPDLTPLAAENVHICEDGALELCDRNDDSRLKIVFADDGRTVSVAGYLAMVLKESFGVEFERYNLPDGADNPFPHCSIFIPRPDDGDRFAVVIDGDGVRFSGRSDFAVYDFCERVLGARHYWDGPGGRSVTKKGDGLRIPFLSYSDSPVFSFRSYSGGSPQWFRVAKGGGVFDRWTQCHTTDDGFCYGSPEGFAEYCRRMDADIAGGERFGRVVDRAHRTISVSPGDVAYDCKCKWCRTLKGHLCRSSGEASPVIWGRFLPRLVKYVSDHHPDYRINVLPYWNYVDIPMDNIDIGTNIQAEVCSMFGLAAFRREEVQKVEEGIILDWARITGCKVANWHYSCWPADYTPAPYVYGHTIAAHYRRMRNHTIGSFICGGKHDFPRFSLSMYIWMRCLWNPDIDVESVYDEFCRRQFGKAAEPMREVIRIQEEDWNPRTLMFPHKSILRLSELMTEAAALVRGTSAAPAFLYYNRGFLGILDRP